MSNGYSPSQTARSLGGLQWAFTAMVIGSSIDHLVIPFERYQWNYLFVTGFTAGTILSFVLGYLWVFHKTENARQEARGIKQRIDYVFLLWLGWPVVYFLAYRTYSMFDLPAAMHPFIHELLYIPGTAIFPVVIVYWLNITCVSRFLSG